MVSLDDATRIVEDRSRSGSGEVTLRQAILLFIAFLLVCSDYVVNNVLSVVPNAMKGRDVLSRGIAVQGILLVLMYALGNHLVEEHIL